MQTSIKVILHLLNLTPLTSYSLTSLPPFFFLAALPNCKYHISTDDKQITTLEVYLITFVGGIEVGLENDLGFVMYILYVPP